MFADSPSACRPRYAAFMVTPWTERHRQDSAPTSAAADWSPLANSPLAGVGSSDSVESARVASHVEQRQKKPWPSAVHQRQAHAAAARRRAQRRLFAGAPAQDGRTLPRPGRARLPSRLREPSSCGGPRCRQRGPLCQPYRPLCELVTCSRPELQLIASAGRPQSRARAATPNAKSTRPAALARLAIAATPPQRRRRQWLREIARDIDGQGWPGLKFNEHIEADGPTEFSRTLAKWALRGSHRSVRACFIGPAVPPTGSG